MRPPVAMPSAAVAAAEANRANEREDSDNDNDNDNDGGVNHRRDADEEAEPTIEELRRDAVADVASCVAEWTRDSFLPHEPRPASPRAHASINSDEHDARSGDSNKSNGDDDDNEMSLLSLTYIHMDAYPAKEWLPVVRDAARAFPVGRKFHNGGTALEIVGCDLGPEGAATIASEILPLIGPRCDEGSHLSVNLENNRLQPAGFTALAAALIAHCRGSLCILNVRENALRDESMPAVAALLAACPNLRELCLGSSHVFPTGMPALAKGLSASPFARRTLRVLSLEFNTLTDAGAIVVCGALRGCHALEDVNLSDNSIGDAGAAAIACDLLAPDCCGPLRKLDVSVNQIQTRGALLIARAVGDLGSPIEWLDVGCNPIGADGGLALAAAAARAPRLAVLDLTTTNLVEAAGELLVRAMEQRPHLKSVRTYECRELSNACVIRLRELGAERQGDVQPEAGRRSNAFMAAASAGAVGDGDARAGSQLVYATRGSMLVVSVVAAVAAAAVWMWRRSRTQRAL